MSSANEGFISGYILVVRRKSCPNTDPVNMDTTGCRLEAAEMGQWHSLVVGEGVHKNTLTTARPGEPKTDS